MSSSSASLKNSNSVITLCLTRLADIHKAQTCHGFLKCIDSSSFQKNFTSYITTEVQKKQLEHIVWHLQNEIYKSGIDEPAYNPLVHDAFLLPLFENFCKNCTNFYELVGIIQYVSTVLDRSYFGQHLAVLGGWDYLVNNNTPLPTSRPSLSSSYSLLSDRMIFHHLFHMNVVIHPFHPHQLKTASYDVTLGSYYYRPCTNQKTARYYNMYDEKHVKEVWGTVPQEAIQAPSELKLPVSAKVILISPGETLLCHTQEFIGGRNGITTMMKARSSIGRNFLSVCKCAGLGDVGYINRWTMEISNHSPNLTIPLVVGCALAQIVFFQTDGTIGNRSYQGKYQSATTLEQLIKSWSPESMLPKLYIN